MTDELLRAGVVVGLVGVGYMFHKMHTAEESKDVEEAGDITKNGISVQNTLYLQGSALNTYKAHTITETSDEVSERRHATSGKVFVPEGRSHQQIPYIQQAVGQLMANAPRKTAMYLAQAQTKRINIPPANSKFPIMKLLSQGSKKNQPPTRVAHLTTAHKSRNKNPDTI